MPAVAVIVSSYTMFGDTGNYKVSGSQDDMRRRAGIVIEKTISPVV